MAGRDTTASDTAFWAPFWYLPLLRAIPAAIVALTITFVGDHSPSAGLRALGAYTLVTGILISIAVVRAPALARVRRSLLPQAVVSVVAGVVALALESLGLGTFLVILIAWAAVTGILELMAGIRARGREVVSRDWVFVGALTALFAVVALVIPAGYVQHYVGPDGVRRVLDTAVVMVGLLGVYTAVVAVYLTIAALSLKWAQAPARQDGTAS